MAPKEEICWRCGAQRTNGRWPEETYAVSNTGAEGQFCPDSIGQRCRSALKSDLMVAENLESEKPQPKKLLFRMPISIHEQAEAAARADGVSLNTYLITAVTSYLKGNIHE